METTHDDTTRLIATGYQAARILADDAMMGFFAELKTDLQEELIHTDVSATQQREAIYYQLRGLVELEEKMKSYRAVAEQLMRQDHINISEDD